MALPGRLVAFPQDAQHGLSLNLNGVFGTYRFAAVCPFWCLQLFTVQGVFVNKGELV